MVIITQANDNIYNPLPRTRQEKKWYREHTKALTTAKELNICPSCGRKLSGNMILINHGYKYGIECEYCR